MKTKKVTHNVENLTGLSLAEVENDIEYLLFVDNEDLFPMTEYGNLQPVIADLAKLIIVHADSAARKMQDELVYNISVHLKKEVGNAVYRAKVPTSEILSVSEPQEVEPHNDW